MKEEGIDLKFKMIGSCKDQCSIDIVSELRARIESERIPNIEVLVNVSFLEVKKEFEKASIGAHFMVDEHFGISVVELLVSIPDLKILRLRSAQGWWYSHTTRLGQRRTSLRIEARITGSSATTSLTPRSLNKCVRDCSAGKTQTLKPNTRDSSSWATWRRVESE